MFYSVNAIDTLFFRSPVPFEAGDEMNLLESQFPPNPSVYAGALRPYVEEKIKDKPYRLRVGFNGIMVDNQFYFPMPLDMGIDAIVDGKEDEKYQASLLQLMKQASDSSLSLPYCLCLDRKEKSKLFFPAGSYLKEADFRLYLEGVQTPFVCMDLSNYVFRENKIGIAISRDTGSAEEHNLYEISQTVLHPKVKMVVEAHRVEIRERGLMKLGGENKMVSIKPMEESISFPQENVNDPYFKLYLATPAIFQNGWLPKFIHPDNRIGRYRGRSREIEVELISAAVGRYQTAGGFGWNKYKKEYLPREQRHMVPAGSVYYFRIRKGSFEDAVHLFHQKCISEYRENERSDERLFERRRYCDRGFGYSFIGRLSKQQGEKVYV